ncbi:hypothetical protein IFR05_016276 [Cadophora sp. M221]|nr:hypothetical protein IFR05_016276 [Cadophora sp. M221]
MAPRLWDAYDTLGVTGRETYSMNCIGRKRNGKRCDVEIDDTPYFSIRCIIDKIEACPPDKHQCPKTLHKLAGLSVCSRCQEYPLNDPDDLVDEWKGCIEQAMQKYNYQLAMQGAKSQLRDKENEIKDLKRTVEKLESRGIRKLHLEIGDLQSELAAQKDKQWGITRSAISQSETLREEVVSLKSQLSQSEEKLAKAHQELETSRADDERASIRIKAMKHDRLGLQNLHKQIKVELQKSKEENKSLLSRGLKLQDELDREREKSSASVIGLQGQLEAAVLSTTKLREVERNLVSQLDGMTDKFDKSTDTINQLTANINTLAATNDGMRSMAAQREENTTAAVAALTRKIAFIKSHPFNTFLVGLMVSMKGWEGTVAGGLRWLKTCITSISSSEVRSWVGYRK